MLSSENEKRKATAKNLKFKYIVLSIDFHLFSPMYYMAKKKR